jgi:mannose-6-phosphate isomerase-like protein (cupin superfamily)
MSTPFALEPGGGDGAQVGSITFTIKAGTEETNGAYSLVEASGEVFATPHIHHDREEAFYILEGRATFLAGEERVEAVPGSFLLVPRGHVHGFRCEGPGKLIIIHSPAGFERFFKETADTIARDEWTLEFRDKLAAELGVTYLDDVTF